MNAARWSLCGLAGAVLTAWTTYDLELPAPTMFSTFVALVGLIAWGWHLIDEA